MKDLLRRLLLRHDYQLMNLRRSQSSRNLLPGHIAKVVRDFGIDLVLDVGANRGQFGQLLRSFGYSGRIISFEPASRPREELEAHASADPRWRVCPFALGSAEGTASLSVCEADDLSSLLPQRPECSQVVPGTTILATENVSIRRLDDVIDDLVPNGDAPRIFLKLDTQGFDLEVLRGARETLDRVVLVQTELSMLPIYEGSPRYIESLQFLDALGFVPTGFFDVTRGSHPNHLVEMDAILGRASAAPMIVDSAERESVPLAL